MKLNNKKQQPTVFVIHVGESTKQQMGESDVVICLAFSQHTHKNKGQLSNDN